MIKTINNAIAKSRAERGDNEKGFTLIELLVVVLIIGILAAIAIPAFLNQRESAWVGQVESDLKNAALAAEQYALDNNGSFAALNEARPRCSHTTALTGRLSLRPPQPGAKQPIELVRAVATAAARTVAPPALRTSTIPDSAPEAGG